MKVTLPNGVIVEGSVEQVEKAASVFGYSIGDDGIHYKSSRLGLVRIHEMSSDHIRNAVNKMYREWTSDLSSLKGEEYLRALRNGPNTKTFNALVTEYTKRVLRGDV